jgi:hypothetical protein
MLEDRAGKDVPFLASETKKFIEEALKRPEIAGITPTFIPAVPQVYVHVNRDKVIVQGRLDWKRFLPRRCRPGWDTTIWVCRIRKK